METRRDFLKLALMFSGASWVSSFVPDSIQRAYAIDPAPGSTYLDAEHIVILMQENRSFDHMLGTLQGVRGFNDPRAIRLGDGRSVFVQTDASGDAYAPWRLDIRDTRITWMGSIPHSRNSQVDAWNEGHHDQWLEAKRSGNPEYADLPITMGHYTREDLPFYYALADAFTVCDQNYCSVMSSTCPNRSYFWTGTIRDQQRRDSKVYMRNDQIENGGLVWKTYPERLQEAGIRWKLYQNELTRSGGLTEEEIAWLSNYSDNNLEFFAAYNIEAYPGYASETRERIAALSAQAAKLKNAASNEADPGAAAELRARLERARDQIDRLKSSLTDCGEAKYRQLTPEQRALHDAAFVTNGGDPNYRSLEPLLFEDEGSQRTMVVPKGDALYQFRKDVDEGRLPVISWLVPSKSFSDHPASPWYGAWYVSEVMDILTRNPEIWKKTIFILTYDENDGYFDHAPSLVAADPKRPETGGASPGIDTGIEYSYVEDELRQGVPKKEARSGPIGLGFRVPMIVASPWSRGGWVNSQIFDHSSTLMFLEQFIQNKYSKTVRETNISAWRRTLSGDLTSIFRPYEAKAPALHFLDRDKFIVSIQRARGREIPSNYTKLTAGQIEDIHHDALHSRFMPHQEPGIRPACALPYELYADGMFSMDRSSYALTLTAGKDAFGEQAAGASLNVYLRNTREGTPSSPEMRVATYVVKPGDTLRKEFPLSLFADSRYSIDVHGPNGFYRSFRGESTSPGLEVHTAYEREGSVLTGNVEVRLRNAGEHPLAVELRDNSYNTGTTTRTVNAGDAASVILRLKRSHNWYDFTVKAEGSEARFAGHVETGKSSFTDPCMGEEMEGIA